MTARKNIWDRNFKELTEEQKDFVRQLAYEETGKMHSDEALQFYMDVKAEQ